MEAGSSVIGSKSLVTLCGLSLSLPSSLLILHVLALVFLVLSPLLPVDFAFAGLGFLLVRVRLVLCRTCVPPAS